MRISRRIGWVTLGLCAQLVTSGCIGAGGGLASLFGSGAAVGEAITLLSSGGSGDGGSGSGTTGTELSSLSGFGLGSPSLDGDHWTDDSSGYIGDDGDTTDSSGSSGGSVVKTVATVHNPEPASLMLFGSGIAGLMCSVRRRKKKNSLR